jgi:uncharacterized BrkB/YihY/UPF0761 family membrane protein
MVEAMFNQMHKVEKIAYPLIALYVLVGMAIALVSPEYFSKVFAKEDGPVEWLTVLALILSFVMCVYRVVTLRKTKNMTFLAVWGFLALLCFFAAGEEVSWGQRIFNIESSEFFKQNNAQQETNLHNMVVEGKKVNKIIFSMVLGLALMTYLLVFTALYRRSEKFKNLCDYMGVPIAHWHQVIAWFAVALIVEGVIRHVSRSSELFESAAVFVFLINISLPYNKEIFEANK